MPVHPLRAARKRRGWSQARLAEQLGVSVRTINRWEQGTALPYPYYRQQLATLFQQSEQALGLLRDLDHQEVVPSSNLSNQFPAPAPSHLAISAADSDQDSWLIDPLIPHTLGHPGWLVGRDTLLTEIKTRLLDDTAVALTALNGLPGVGKTALATALALDSTVRAHFSDGILWAALGPQPNVLAQLARWGALLGIRPDEVEVVQQESAWSRALHAAIGARRMLFVIDDAWSSEAALPFQVGGPHCAYLLTTRLPTIAFTFAGQEAIAVPELPDAHGLALLARYVPDLVQVEPEQARALVQAVGGLPLALSLIGHMLAAQVATDQPRRLQRVLQQMNDAQQRLHINTLSAIDEQPHSLPDGSPRSLQTTIALSDQQLSVPAHEALLALAVYPPKPNSFSEEAACRVMAAPVELLDELWDAGLLESSEPGRYTLHQTIADYAHVQTTPGQRVALYQRLIGAWLPVLREHSSDYGWLDQEWAIVQMVIDRAMQAGPELKPAFELVRVLSGLQPYLRARGLLAQAERYAQRGIALIEGQGDQEGHVLLLRDLAAISLERGEYPHMEQMARQGLQIAQSQQVQVRCDLLRLLGVVRQSQGQRADALALFQEALELARQSRDALCHCQVLRNLAGLARRSGQYEQARVLLEEGLAVARQQELHEHVCAFLNILSQVIFEQGQCEQAKQIVDEGLHLAQHYCYRARQGSLLEMRGMIEATQGQMERANHSYEQALAIFRQVGRRLQISAVLGNLADRANRVGSYEQGERYARESLELAGQLGARDFMINALINLGTAVGKLGDENQANILFEEALQLAQAFRYPVLVANALYEWGEVLLYHQQVEAAAQRFQDLLTLSSTPQASSVWRVWAQWELARVALLRGEGAEARRLGQVSLEALVTMKDALARQVRLWLDDLSREEGCR